MTYPFWKRILLSLLVISAMALTYFSTNSLTDIRTSWNVYSSIDARLPFINPAIFFYTIGYSALLAMPALLLEEREIFLKAMIGIAFITVVSCSFFLCFPTTTYRPQIIGSNFFTHLYAYLHAIDGPNNCFPSMHVSLSCFLGWFLHEKGYFKIWPLIIAFLVTLSTIFTKQHAIIDIFGGLAITWFSIKLIQSTYLTKLLARAY